MQMCGLGGELSTPERERWSGISRIGSDASGCRRRSRKQGRCPDAGQLHGGPAMNIGSAQKNKELC